MKVLKMRFFRQVRLDGKEYFYASVTFDIGKWFFGLFTYTQTMYIEQGYKMDSFLLVESNQYQYGFETLDDAKLALDKCINDKINDYKRKKIVSYSQVNT